MAKLINNLGHHSERVNTPLPPLSSSSKKIFWSYWVKTVRQCSQSEISSIEYVNPFNVSYFLLKVPYVHNMYTECAF